MTILKITKKKKNKTNNNITIKKKEKLKEWKKYKTSKEVILKISSKYVKQAFNMHKIHKYTIASFTKDIFLRVLLIKLTINTTEKTKTALQQLSQQ